MKTCEKVGHLWISVNRLRGWNRTPERLESDYFLFSIQFFQSVEILVSLTSDSNEKNKFQISRILKVAPSSESKSFISERNQFVFTTHTL